MKRKFRLSLVMLSNLIFSQFLTIAQNDPIWKSLGPENLNTANIGIVTAVAMSPDRQNVVYAGTRAGGLWKGTLNTTSGKYEWVNITDNIDARALGVGYILIDPVQNLDNGVYKDVIYFTTNNWNYSGDGGDEYYGSGIWKSTNGGGSWTNVLNGQWIKKIVMNPSNSQEIYAIDRSYIWSSQNSGNINTWNGFNPTLATGAYFNDIEFNISDPTKLLISTDGNGTSQSQLFLYNSSSNTLTDISQSFFGNTKIEIDFTNYNQNGTDLRGTTFICLTDNGNAIRISSFDGTSWSTVLSLSNPTQWGGKSEFEVSENNPSIFYIGGNEIYRLNSSTSSINCISQYTPTTGSYSTHADIRSLQILNINNDFLLMGHDGGIAICLDGVNANSYYPYSSWQNINGPGLIINEVEGFDYFLSNDDQIIGTQDNGTIVEQQNTWNHKLGGDAGVAIVDKETEQIVYAQMNCGQQTINNVVYYCQDIERSNNRGGTFNSIGMPEHSKNSFAPYPMIFDPNDYHNIWYGVYDIHKYDDQTSSWTNYTITGSSNVVKAMAIAKGNSNCIYVVYKAPTYGDSSQEKLFFTSDGGTTFHGITPNSPGQPFSYNSGSDVVVDPEDPTHIFVSFEGEKAQNSVPIYRVYEGYVNFSTYTASWTDISNGLPKYPVYSLAYYEGSSLIFAGTDNGVYMLDNSLSNKEWVKYGSGIPNSIVTQIRINKCRNKLIAATRGRGMWECDLPSLDPLSLTSDVTYSTGTTTFFDRDVVVNSGVTMYVYGTLNFAADKKLFIKKGARVIASGATFSNSCNTRWFGILVEGDNSLDQAPISNQGYLSLYNSTIQNAISAVNAVGYKTNGDFDWTKTGSGIIIGTNSTFTDNAMHVYIPGYKRPNNLNIFSRFTNCTFELNKTGMTNNTQSMKEMLMVCTWGVKGLQFSGCTFKNTNPTQNISDANSYRGTGIYAWDASVIVQDIKAGVHNNQQNGNFMDLSRGVHLVNSYTEASNINNNTFLRNDVCILFEDGDRGSIYRNEFRLEFPSTYPSSYLNNRNSGIFTNNAGGFQISENNFITDLNSFSQHTEIGSVFRYTGASGGTYYLNQHNGTFVGEQTENDNQNMIIACNSHQGHSVAMALNPVASGNALEPISYLPSFGKCNTNNANYKYDKNNTFNTSNTYDISNYTYTNPPYTPSIKEYVIDATAQLRPRSTFSQQMNINNCAQQVYNCTQKLFPDEPSSWVTDDGKFGVYQLLKYEKFGKKALLDNGGAQGLIDDILNSEADLYQELMDKSPYLSNEVMISMLQYSQNLSETEIVNILVANSKLDQDVIDALDYRNFSQGSLDAISNAQSENDPSARTTLNEEIYILEIQLSASRNDLLNYYALGNLVDTVNNYGDSIIYFLGNENDLLSIKQLIPIYIEKGMTNEASDLIQSISETQSDAENQNFVSLMTVLNDLKIDSANVFQMSNHQEETIREISVSGTHIESAAKNILSLVFNEYFEVLPAPIPENYNKKGQEQLKKDNQSKPLLSASSNHLLNIYPNPASSFLNINFMFTKHYNNKSASITDVSGKLISFYPIATMSGSIDVNTMKMENGVYFVKLIGDDNIISFKKFVIIN